VAAPVVVAAGYTVLARRFRSGHRDLDLVVARGGVVAFVEVKTAAGRRSAARSRPCTGASGASWCAARRVWVARFGRPGVAYRFDVFGVLVGRSETGGGRVRVRHLADCIPSACGA
jgi:putative endonuclease